ncbi:MAG: flagellar motor switch protein FliN [Terracidiphilus sp.]|jgi:flagellar motor switch protein FliN/FliY
MTNHDRQTATRKFVQGFAEALAGSLTGAAGQPWNLTIMENYDPSAQPGSPIVFRLTLEGLLRGEFFLEFDTEQLKLLATAINTNAGQPVGDDGQAVKSVLSSAMKMFLLSLFADYGTVTCKIEQVLGPELKGMFAILVAAEAQNSSSMAMTCYLNGKLIESLSPGLDTKASAGADAASFDPVNLNLVLDVELSMSLRFGGRQLPLREVLELASGSVVELDRQVDDPVELLLDGRVIARGEAVIVDGNYGLRVTEITEPIASSFVR